MADLKQATWLKYVVVLIVAVIAGYVLPPSTWADNPGRVLVRVAIIVTSFGIILLALRIWPPCGERLISTRRFVAFFAVFVVVLFALEFFRPKLFSWLEDVGLGGVIGRLVEAWGGWLLPLLFLGVFLAFVLLRWRRRRVGQ